MVSINSLYEQKTVIRIVIRTLITIKKYKDKQTFIEQQISLP